MTTASRGEVWRVRFDPSVGSEVHKIRPAVAVSVDQVGRLPLRIVVPITDWKKTFSRYPWFVHLAPSRQNGLSKESGADCFQVKSVSSTRFVGRLGSLTVEQMEQIAAAIAIRVGFA